MGPRGVGNPLHSSLPPSRPPDPSQFKLKLQAHKEEVAARFSKLSQSLTAFAVEQEEFQLELKEELWQLRLSYSNPSTTMVSTSPSSLITGNPSSPNYCQLPEPPPIPNCKPQSQILDPKPLASFTLLQNLFHTSPPRTVPPSLPPVVKPSSILETIKPKFHSPTTLGTQAITHKGCMGVWQHGRVETHTNNQGNQTTSSYLAFTDIEHLISEVAKNQVTMNLINTLSDAKSLIGRKFSDFSVQGDISLWPFKVFDKPMINVTYKGEGKQIAAEEILFMVLIKMREIQAILEGLKIRKGHEQEHCFSGVDKRVCDKGGGHTFQLGNNLKVLIFETSVEEICVKELSVEFFGKYMESNGQCVREPFSSLQFCESFVNLNILKAQFRSSNKGGFTYDMRLENWTERTAGNAPKLSVRPKTKGSGKSEVLIFDQETNFQQRVYYLERATGLLKSNFGSSFASLIGSCSKEQHKIYKDWFNLVDSDGDGYITGNEGMKFFAMSKLSRPELKQVWAIADSKRQGLLEFTEFVTAMQLISVAQEHELSPDILKFEVDWENITPPVIEGLDAFIAKTKSSTTNGITMNGITPNQPSSQWFALKSVKKLPLNVVTSIVDGLKRLYIEKLKSLEVAYHFNDFGNPLLTHSVFDAKPMAMLKQNLHKAQERIKLFHDKWHTVRTFEVGDFVYMKLQSYKQQSVQKRTVHKLLAKYYGPSKEIERIGTVAYKLKLPAINTMLVKRKGQALAKWLIKWIRLLLKMLLGSLLNTSWQGIQMLNLEGASFAVEA